MNKSVTIIDVGSSKIAALTGERGVNGTFAVHSVYDAEYEGFSEGKFFDESDFRNAVITALSAVVDSSYKRINEIFVGVPGAFIRIENRKFRLSFGRRKRVSEKDENDLIEAGKKKIALDGYEPIYASAIYYSLDDNRKVLDPRGVATTSLGGLVTYQLCEKYFSDAVRSAVASVVKTDVGFVFDGYAEGRFLLGESDYARLIIDVGYITTTSTVFMGNGVVAKDSFDFGGGYLTAALVEKYGLSPSSAEKLKREVRLGYIRGGKSQYLAELDGYLKSLSVEDVNETVKSALDELAGNVDSFLEENSAKVKINEIYITGGGISAVRGAAEHIAGRLGQAVEVLAPSVPGYNKAIYSSAISLLDFALSNKKRFYGGIRYGFNR